MINHSEFTFDLPALRVMEKEHRLFKFLMEEWRPIVLKFERNKFNQEQGHKAFLALHTKIEQFMEPLHNHFDKEERYLFPLLAQYIGNDHEMILAAEKNHEEIHQCINCFFDVNKEDVSKITLPQMKEAATEMGKVYELLSCHFFKKETFIFPMLEDILEPREQEQLYKNITSTLH